MKISVVVLAYNEEKYIGACIECLLNQTRLPEEIIIVNNNSTDKTRSIAEKYPVRIIDEKKQGITYARDAGFDAATGDIVVRTDADSYPVENWLEKIENDFAKKIVAVGGPVIYPQIPIPSVLIKPFFLSLHKYYNFSYRRSILIGSNIAISKKAWMKVKQNLICDDKKVHEDFDLSYKIAEEGKVLFDWDLVMYSSHRRLVKKPLSLLIEYPVRNLKTWLRVKNIIK